MSRGNWGFFLAAVAWLIVSASPPKQIANPEQIKAQQQAEKATHSKEGEPCQPGDDKRYSDLCAQWKAADASDLAAWLSGIGLVGVAIALVLNAQSNWISSRTSRAQLRAYLSMTGVGYWGMTNDGHDPCYSIGFKNTGATPLYDYRGYTLAYIAKTAHLPHSITDEKLHALRSDLIGPSGSVEKKGKLKPTKEQQEGFANGTHHVFLISASHYRDAFGRHFRFDCCYRSNFKTAPVNMWPVFVRERRVWFWERWRERRRRIANDGRRHR